MSSHMLGLSELEDFSWASKAEICLSIYCVKLCIYPHLAIKLMITNKMYFNGKNYFILVMHKLSNMWLSGPSKMWPVLQHLKFAGPNVLWNEKVFAKTEIYVKNWTNTGIAGIKLTLILSVMQ